MTQSQPRTSRFAWWILAAVGLIFALFAGDRAVLGILKTTLSTEIGLTNSGYSILVTAFMIPYTAMYPFMGGWIDRFGAKRMLLLCVIGMSVATIVAGTAHGLGQLIVARFVLGIAEAGVVPAITVTIFAWFASERRAVAYSLANAVQSTAYILFPPFVAAVTLGIGWRWSFLIPGLGGLVVAAIWWSINRAAGEPPQEVGPVATVPATGLLTKMRELWQMPAVKILIIGRIISDPFWFFFQYWQTAFLQEKVGMSLARVGQLTWIPPLVYTIVALALSAYSDKLIMRGWAAPKARLVLILLATTLAPAAFFLPLVRTEMMAIVLVTLVSIMCSTWLNMASVFMGALVPKHSIASAIGLMSALGGVTSILFNGAIGTIIDYFGYNVPFFIGACLHPIAAGLLAWHFLRRSPTSTSTAVPV